MDVPNTVNRHVSLVETAIASRAGAASAIIASWRRSSAAHKLDPAEFRPPRRLTDTELKEARQAIEPLVKVAEASLDRLFLAVGGAGCCVLLADRNGVPVDRRGAPADDKTFHSWGLWEGAVWSEDSEGTNGIGTCIVEQRTLTIHRDQHFFARNMLLSCTTAPIFDHEGKLMAVLDVSSCRADLVEGFLHLISIAASDAARRIEAEHFRASFPHARIMLVPAPDRHATALVAIDGDDLVVGANRPARQLLGITQGALDKGLLAGPLIKGTPVAGQAAGPEAGSLDHAADAFAEAERGVLHRALVEADGRLSAAAKALGISRTTLYRKRKKMHLESPRR
jgi:transcriptional regulator of acetoin/glycerol metabolism